MKSKKKYILILLLTMFSTILSAQNSQVLYYMNLPQNHLLNPAMRPSNSFYLGLPSINLNINNNLVSFSDLFINSSTSDSVLTFLDPRFKITDFLDKVLDKNSIEPEFTLQLFGLGFSVGKGAYVFLDINERFSGNIVIPGDIFKLGLTGNGGFQGNQIDLSSFRADVKYYREVGLGFSKSFTNKLRIGVKGKLLFGIASASIDNNSFGITVSDNYTHTLDADLVANVSLPLNVTRDASHNISKVEFNDSRFDTKSGIIDFVTGKKNMGFGFDIGATYDITSKFVVSAAITDLGYIKWKQDVINFQIKSQYEFNGLDMIDVLNGTKTFDELGKAELDTLKDSFKVTDSSNSFTTYLPVGVSLGANYKLTKRFSVGVLSYSRFIGKQLKEAVTLSGNLNLGNAFSTTLTYTIANHRYDNLGAGIAFRPGIFQFYMLVDRIPVMWNNIKFDSSSIPLPTSLNTINLRIGMNLAFGNRVKKKADKPMLKAE
jgi:hypothetical protein